MKKILLIIAFFSLIFFSSIKNVSAQVSCGLNPNQEFSATDRIISFKLGDQAILKTDTNYKIDFWITDGVHLGFISGKTDNEGILQVSINQDTKKVNEQSFTNLFDIFFNSAAQENLTIYVGGFIQDPTCVQTVSIRKTSGACQEFNITDKDKNFPVGETVSFNGTTTGLSQGIILFRQLLDPDGSEAFNQCDLVVDKDGKFTGTVQIPGNTQKRGLWTVNVGRCHTNTICTANINVALLPGQKPAPPKGQPGTSNPCGGATEDALTSCKSCLGDKFEKTGSKSWTALGCIPTTFDGTSTDTNLIMWILMNLAIPTGGGVAFLIMLWGVFSMITSSGNPEKLNNGKEIITSALAGLVMILFSVFLLKLIGVDILGIPGFM